MGISHAPPGWVCIFCQVAAGGETLRTRRSAVVLQTDTMTAFVASHWWPANPGHVLVIPNAHIENLYGFPDSLGGDLMMVTRRIASAMKAAYRCHGVSTRQHNEPAGNQDVWHFHQHVFPRYRDDRLYERHAERSAAPIDEIEAHARMLRAQLG